MTIKFSEKLQKDIEKEFKSNFSKEELYHYIDKLENNSFNKYDYSSFRDYLNKYSQYISNESSSLNLNSLKVSISDEIYDNVRLMFKEINHSDYISVPDNALVQEYAAKFFNRLNDNLFDNPSQLLESKLGTIFKEFSNERTEENLKITINKHFYELMINNDTHRYSDEVLQCFVNGLNTESFIEAISQCQYAMHGVKVSGDAPAQDL